MEDTKWKIQLSSKELELMNAYWRACNYLSVGMIYLKDDALLKEPLKTEHVKHRLLGHWGASPALSFVWVHLNRMIVKHDLDVIFVAGPGHGAPGVLGPAYLEGTYSEIYPDKSEDAEGMQKFFKQFSFPGGYRQPRHSGNAWLHSRRRRARLQPVPRLRHGVRQSRSDRRLRRR